MAKAYSRTSRTVPEYRKIASLLRRQIVSVDAKLENDAKQSLRGVRAQITKIRQIAKESCAGSPISPLIQTLEKYTPFGSLPLNPNTSRRRGSRTIERIEQLIPNRLCGRLLSSGSAPQCLCWRTVTARRSS